MIYNNSLIDTSVLNSVVWDTGIYTRISEEERVKSIADSIVNQKKILKDYAKKNNLNVVKIYEDDGYRGGSFNRPAFKNMIADIEGGIINCVLVKDLSRFGREHIDTDHYLERYFPIKGVRFISAIQGLDSVADPERMNSIEVPLINIFNEQYLKQVSNSTKASLMIKRKEGKFVGAQVPYGYSRSSDDKHKLVVDEYAKPIVEAIFKWYLNYMSMSAIANRLNDKNILPPASYRRLKNSKAIDTNRKWSCATIKTILSQEIYTGDMIQGKTYSYNCKINKREPLPREKWDIVLNTHEPIISRKMFSEAQVLLNRKAKPSKSHMKTTPSILSGFLTCADCGKKMVRNIAVYDNATTDKAVYNRFICSTYKKLGSKACASHLVGEDTIKEILLDTLNTMINCIVDVSKAIERANEKELKNKIAMLENDIYKINVDIKKISKLITGLYSDYKEDIISLDEYKEMKASFEEKRDVLISKLDMLKQQINNLKSNGNMLSENISKYIAYEGLIQLDRKMIVDLIDEIIIDQDKNITINFKFQDEIKKYCSFFD